MEYNAHIIKFQSIIELKRLKKIKNVIYIIYIIIEINVNVI